MSAIGELLKFGQENFVWPLSRFRGDPYVVKSDGPSIETQYKTTLPDGEVKQWDEERVVYSKLTGRVVGRVYMIWRAGDENGPRRMFQVRVSPPHDLGTLHRGTVTLSSGDVGTAQEVRDDGSGRQIRSDDIDSIYLRAWEKGTSPTFRVIWWALWWIVSAFDWIKPLLIIFGGGYFLWQVFVGG